MAIASPCRVCSKAVSQLGTYVKIASGLMHFECAIEARLQAEYSRGRADVLREINDQKAKELMAKEAEAKALAEKAAAEKAALAQVNAEKTRAIAMTKAATEKLKAQEQGPAQDRFALIEMDATPEEVAAIAVAKQARADEAAAKAAADKCVRCGAPGPHGTYHPRHCSACWNSAAPKAEVSSQNGDEIAELVKKNVRPIEID